jgi:hypothetical protein
MRVVFLIQSLHPVCLHESAIGKKGEKREWLKETGGFPLSTVLENKIARDRFQKEQT